MVRGSSSPTSTFSTYKLSGQQQQRGQGSSSSKGNRSLNGSQSHKALRQWALIELQHPAKGPASSGWIIHCLKARKILERQPLEMSYALMAMGEGQAQGALLLTLRLCMLAPLL